MFSDVAVNMMRAAKANPTIAALSCTALGFYTVRVHYMKKSIARLEENNRELQTALKERKDTLNQRLSQLEEAVKKDFAQRDAFMRKMELQNVEQTRSVDRLQHTLRSCSTTSHSAAAAANAQHVLNAHQQQQQHNQHQKDSHKVALHHQQQAQQPHLHADDVVPQPGAAMAASPPEEISAQKASYNNSAPMTAAANAQVESSPLFTDTPIVVVQDIDRLDQLRQRVVQNSSGEPSQLAFVPAATAVAAVGSSPVEGFPTTNIESPIVAAEPNSKSE